MFNRLSKKILGPKKGKEELKPYSDIPIFENVDSIGLPGLSTVNMSDPSFQAAMGGDDSKTPTKQGSFPRPMTTRSGQKRARDALLGDKENVPRLPGASNVLDVNDYDHHHSKMGAKVEKKTQYYDEKHADSDEEEEGGVTVETVESEDESDDEMMSASPVKRSRLDNRFHTERPTTKKGKTGSSSSGSSSKKVAFSMAQPEDDDDEDEGGDVNGVMHDQHDHEHDDEYDDENAKEQLFSKVRHGHHQWVKHHIHNSGRDLNKGTWAVDERGNTLLHVAVQNNHTKLASLLIKEGIDINRTNKKGMTCLDYAEMYHFSSLADFLMGFDALNGYGS
jgi:hypothetical protein